MSTEPKAEGEAEGEVSQTQPKEELDNSVLVGKKPVMSYVVACLTFFNAGKNEVVVKARGRAISKAVDTVELLRRSFMKEIKIKDIKIGTVELTRAEGTKANVSTIEISLVKEKE
ncbi:DNA-binding protein Alba [Candidatus Bathyarchaeota archaeon]|nr:DNA-binding protein Alba [Candidatus Bathyarchaeota archaeon]HDM45134.1 DNA-binding protein Alba [Candidatus Bathyarchaeota archaeon]